MIKVIIVDDHAVLRSGLRLLIDREPDISVVAEAGDGTSAIQQIGAHQPDVVLMDISLPDMTGTDVIRHFKMDKQCSCQFLVLTMHCEDDWLRTVLDAGASGYVVKSVADDELLVAIRAVHSGHSFLRPEAVSVLLDDSVDANRPEEILSEREIEVLKLVSRGFTNAEIGEQLFVSHKTVDTYRRRVMQKLGLDTRADLVDYALKHKLLQT